MLFESEIKTALKKAGLSEDLYDQITVKSVDEIEGAIATLKSGMDEVKNLTESEFLAAVKKAGLENQLNKYLQSQTDRRVTEAVKTHEANLKKAAEDEAAKKKTEEDQKTMTVEQKEIQALKETIKGLAEKLDGVATKVTTDDKSSRIRAELKAQGLSEKFESNIVVDDPEKIAEAVTNFKSTFDEHQQAIINDKLSKGELSPVKKGEAGQTIEENQVATYAKSLGVNGVPKNPDFQGKISAERAASAAKAAAS